MSSKQTQWVFWCTSEFSASFTLSLQYIYICLLPLISFLQLSSDSTTTSGCPFHSSSDRVVQFVGISQLTTFIYFVYVQKSIITEAFVHI